MCLPLLHGRSWLTLVAVDWVHHNLIWVLWSIRGIPLAPIVTHRIRENGTVAVEGRRGNGRAGGGVALETVLGVLVPEMECSIGTSGTEGAVDWMEGNGVHRVAVCDIARRGVTVTFE
jgi:hypothetical protein